MSELHVHSMYTACTQHVHSTYTACTQHVHSMYTACTQHVHSMYTACTQHVHSMYTACTQHVHSMYTACTQHVHSMYTASCGIMEKRKARNNPEMEGRTWRWLNNKNNCINWVTCQCRCHAISSQTWIEQLRCMQHGCKQCKLH